MANFGTGEDVIRRNWDNARVRAMRARVELARTQTKIEDLLKDLDEATRAMFRPSCQHSHDDEDDPQETAENLCSKIHETIQERTNAEKELEDAEEEVQVCHSLWKTSR
jgi:hypothetical protein